MSHYTEEELDNICEVLRKSYPTRDIDFQKLRSDLTGLIQNRELSRVDDDSQNTADSSANTAKPLCDEIARHTKLQGAINSVTEAVAEIKNSSGLAAQLRLALSSRLFRIRRPSPPETTDWRTFINTIQYDLNILKEASQKASVYLNNINKRGPKADTQKYGLIVELGDIFIEATNANCGFDDLEYGENTTFVRFLQKSLSPFYPVTKITPKALSNDIYRLRYGLPDTLNKTKQVKS